MGGSPLGAAGTLWLEEAVSAIVSMPSTSTVGQELYLSALAYLQDHLRTFPVTLPGAFCLQTKGASRNVGCHHTHLALLVRAGQCPRSHKGLSGSKELPQTTQHIKSTERLLLCKTTFGTTKQRETIERRLESPRSSQRALVDHRNSPGSEGLHCLCPHLPL